MLRPVFKPQPWCCEALHYPPWDPLLFLFYKYYIKSLAHWEDETSAFDQKQQTNTGSARQSLAISKSQDKKHFILPQKQNGSPTIASNYAAEG